MTVAERRSRWLTIEGILLIILGVFALLAPLFAGLALAVTIGVLLLVAGVAGVVSAIAGRAHSHQGWSLLSAVIALVIGLLLVISPLTGAVAITLLIGAYLLLDGISLIGLSFDHRRRGDRAWAWLLVAGVVDIILAGFIVLLSAAGSAVLIGFIVGLDLIVAGVALLMLHRRGALTPPAS